METNIKSTSLPDSPYSEEIDLGTERYVNGLIKFIENSSTPMTIALQGEWGSGKTSLMNRLERTLCTEKSLYEGLTINTWEHSMLATPEETVYKILSQLVQRLTENDSQTNKKVKKILRKAGNVIYRGAREALKMIPGVGIVLEASNVPTQPQSADEPEESEAALSELKEILVKAVKATIEKSNKRGVIIFVDDLDRLNPPVAVEILELLKNLFCIENCIFVLAIDYEVVVKGLEPKFGKLTDKNEREFRSFFDKIIQVPFSLPVSSYRPMDYVLKSLDKIDYFKGKEKYDDDFRSSFTQIVEHSVGKNPRSIKRLINTFSLLSCISECGEEENKDFIESREGRIATFAIVAMQVCYPKIYKMLSEIPDFHKWDKTLCERMNIRLQTKNEPNQTEEEQYMEWELILEKVCESDPYLTQHHNDIKELLRLIRSNAESENETDTETNIRSIIDKSSITRVNEPPIGQSVFDNKKLIDHLHRNVIQKIKNECPEISKIKTKRNTGNGGFDVFYEDTKSMEIILRPYLKNNSKIDCEIIVPTVKRRPERLMGTSSFNEIIADAKVKSLFDIMDNCVVPLLSDDSNYFSGRTYIGQKTYFKSFSEEQEFRFKQGWLDNILSANVSYWITFENNQLYADNTEPINAITNVIIAAYRFRKAAQNL